MKVIQILPELNAGGVERGTVEIASFLVRQGHDSIIISHGGRMVSQLEAEGSRHITLPVHRKNPLTLLQVHALRRYLTSEKPDILHIRSRIPGWVAWLAWRGMDPDTRPRLVTTVHGFYSVNRYSAVMTRGERVIAVSESIRRYLLECYPGIDLSRIRVVPRGIEPAAYPSGYQPPDDWRAAWLSAHPELHGKITLLLPGRITRLKGHEDLFRLLVTLKHMGIPAHGLVAGDTHPKKTAYLSELKDLVHALGLADDVGFLGHRTDLREIMAVCDLVCALSQQPESFGRTVLEALALGKPVVGYDCGGVGELLKEFFACGLIPMGDSARLAAISSHIIHTRPVPSPVGDPYTLESMRSGTLAVYRELCDSPR